MKKIIFLMSLLLSTMVFSKTTYVQVGVTPTLNVFQGEEVKGVRIPVIFGRTTKITGLDFNLLAGETDEMVGFQGGIFLGAGIITKVNKRFRGFGFSMANIHGGDSKGVLVGSANITNEFSGLKIGLLNYSKTSSGVEFGIVNDSKEAFFQLGIINIAEKINGVQIGLANFAKNGILPVMPFINFNWKL